MEKSTLLTQEPVDITSNIKKDKKLTYDWKRTQLHAPSWCGFKRRRCNIPVSMANMPNVRYIEHAYRPLTCPTGISFRPGSSNVDLHVTYTHRPPFLTPPPHTCSMGISLTPCSSNVDLHLTHAHRFWYSSLLDDDVSAQWSVWRARHVDVRTRHRKLSIDTTKIVRRRVEGRREERWHVHDSDLDIMERTSWKIVTHNHQSKEDTFEAVYRLEPQTTRTGILKYSRLFFSDLPCDMEWNRLLWSNSQGWAYVTWQ